VQPIPRRIHAIAEVLLLMNLPLTDLLERVRFLIYRCVPPIPRLTHVIAGVLLLKELALMILPLMILPLMILPLENLLLFAKLLPIDIFPLRPHFQRRLFENSAMASSSVMGLLLVPLVLMELRLMSGPLLGTWLDSNMPLTQLLWTCLLVRTDILLQSQLTLHLPMMNIFSMSDLTVNPIGLLGTLVDVL
jgi:hypothetical protein